MFNVLKPLALALVVATPASWAEPHRMIAVTGESRMEAVGVTLGPVVSIGEASGARPRPVTMETARTMDVVPVAAGELTLAASVTMMFEIADT